MKRIIIAVAALALLAGCGKTEKLTPTYNADVVTSVTIP